MKKYIIIPSLVSVGFLFMGCDKTNDRRSSGNMTFASPAEIEKWELTNKTLFGIRAHDPEGGHLRTINQDRGVIGINFWRHTYIAFFNDKQNVGGTLNRYGSYPESNNSTDINLWMVLFNEYHQYYDKVKSNKNDEWLFTTVLTGEDLQCGSYDQNVPFLLGEIAVPNTFINNNSYFRPTTSHCESGTYLHKLDTFGMYGVLTTDYDHGNGPEVHPAQQFWFRDKNILTKNKSAYWLFFVQDASRKFDDWSRSPVYGQFQIAFRVHPEKIKFNVISPLIMDISIGDKSDVVTNDYPDQRLDGDNGTSHSLVVDGKKILTVNESGGEDTDMGIQFIELRKLQDGTIQGYVQVSMVIGDYNNDAIGLSILHLLVTQPHNLLVSEDIQGIELK